jgi:polysaccharide export outer membrane protein
VPYVGDLDAKGRTVADLRQEISGKLSEYFVSPVLNVSLQRFSKPKVYVLGEVKTPGVYRIDADTTAVEAIAMAGGISRDGNTKMVVVLRSRPHARDGQDAQPVSISLDDLMAKAEVRQNIRLRGGDIILVPLSSLAEANKIALFIGNLISPIFQAVGVITQIVILSQTSRN